jgi:hypothetical protein
MRRTTIRGNIEASQLQPVVKSQFRSVSVSDRDVEGHNTAVKTNSELKSVGLANVSDS